MPILIRRLSDRRNICIMECCKTAASGSVIWIEGLFTAGYPDSEAIHKISACRPGNPKDTNIEEITALYKSLL